MSSSNTKDKQTLKFRPPLSPSQVETIVSLILRAQDRLPICEDFDSNALNALKRIFVPLIAKIEVGAINPAYSISQRLEETRNAARETERYMKGEMTPEESLRFEANALGLG